VGDQLVRAGSEPIPRAVFSILDDLERAFVELTRTSAPVVNRFKKAFDERSHTVDAPESQPNGLMLALGELFARPAIELRRMPSVPKNNDESVNVSFVERFRTALSDLAGKYPRLVLRLKKRQDQSAVTMEDVLNNLLVVYTTTSGALPKNVALTPATHRCRIFRTGTDTGIDEPLYGEVWDTAEHPYPEDRLPNGTPIASETGPSIGDVRRLIDAVRRKQGMRLVGDWGSHNEL